jgi:dTDP-4-amino-4,6-dideoxygalactose transaminase
MSTPIPLLRPNPPRLSRLVDELRAIEASGIYSNYGPVNTRFEAALTNQLFAGAGGCLTVNNATIGLMLAIKEAIVDVPIGQRRYALMPSFTFAATAHAALWAGLVPLLCDVDEETWMPSAQSEDSLLREYAGLVAVIVPYATFGNCLDLERYDALSREHGIPIVVDAAASLGSNGAEARNFGSGFRWPVVYSMHATKTFATAEAGLIYCNDPERLAKLRIMGNFGFGKPRTATMPGINAKLSEIGALLGLAKLAEFEKIVEHRAMLAALYRSELEGIAFQRSMGSRLAYQFMPAMLPEKSASQRDVLLAMLAKQGIGTAQYFSPHLAEQPYFAQSLVCGDLSITQKISRRIITLPMADDMTADEVGSVCTALGEAMGSLDEKRFPRSG